MFQIDRRLIPPTIEHIHGNLQPRTDPEVLHRRKLLADALAGNEEAKTTLRTTYHLTRWINNGRDILSGGDENKSRRRQNRHAR